MCLFLFLSESSENQLRRSIPPGKQVENRKGPWKIHSKWEKTAHFGKINQKFLPKIWNTPRGGGVVEKLCGALYTPCFEAPKPLRRSVPASVPFLSSFTRLRATFPEACSTVSSFSLVLPAGYK
jgi:hypothetical protein